MENLEYSTMCYSDPLKCCSLLFNIQNKEVNLNFRIINTSLEICTLNNLYFVYNIDFISDM